MTLTTSLVADLHAIHQAGRVKPETPEQHDVIRQLFDLELLTIHPAGADSTYSVNMANAAQYLLPKAQQAAE